MYRLRVSSFCLAASTAASFNSLGQLTPARAVGCSIAMVEISNTELHRRQQKNALSRQKFAGGYTRCYRFLWKQVGEHM